MQKLKRKKRLSKMRSLTASLLSMFLRKNWCLTYSITRNLQFSPWTIVSLRLIKLSGWYCLTMGECQKILYAVHSILWRTIAALRPKGSKIMKSGNSLSLSQNTFTIASRQNGYYLFPPFTSLSCPPTTHTTTITTSTALQITTPLIWTNANWTKY